MTIHSQLNLIDNNLICTTFCVGRSKQKAGIHLKCYPENRDTTEMYPGKVMHISGG